MDQCEKCGCSPCDCGTTVDHEVSYYGRHWEKRRPEDLWAESLASLIEKRGQVMPLTLRNASLEEVAAYLKQAS
jgi:hypothetical protein